ncbi:MAG: hypothetical protein JSS64_06975 [Bacteroidetes bacterium]|nr:hypothetical protein [Bacteroidota bacterium]
MRKKIFTKQLTPIEERRVVVEKQATHIRSEIEALLNKTDIWVDVTEETSSIDDALTVIEEEFSEVETEMMR